MKTIATKQISEKERTWYIVDAKDKNLGRLSTKIATILRWKEKVDFASHLDNWDYVIVLNSWKFSVTWNKLNDKMYYTHSWYLWGIKKSNLSDLLEKKPTKALELAVYGMLPKNKLRYSMLSRLKLVEWEEHKFSAQKPKELKI